MPLKSPTVVLAGGLGALLSMACGGAVRSTPTVDPSSSWPVLSLVGNDLLVDDKAVSDVSALAGPHVLAGAPTDRLSSWANAVRSLPRDLPTCLRMEGQPGCWTLTTRTDRAGCDLVVGEAADGQGVLFRVGGDRLSVIDGQDSVPRARVASVVAERARGEVCLVTSRSDTLATLHRLRRTAVLDPRASDVRWLLPSDGPVRLATLLGPGSRSGDLASMFGNEDSLLNIDQALDPDSGLGGVGLTTQRRVLDRTESDGFRLNGRSVEVEKLTGSYEVVPDTSEIRLWTAGLAGAPATFSMCLRSREPATRCAPVGHLGVASPTSVVVRLISMEPRLYRYSDDGLWEPLSMGVGEGIGGALERLGAGHVHFSMENDQTLFQLEWVRSKVLVPNGARVTWGGPL